MSKLYTAIIMDKHYIGENSFIFSCNHAVTGNLDETTNIFTDTHGNEYTTIVDPSLLRSELPTGFFNAVDLSEVPSKMPDGKKLSLGDYIKEFEKQARNTVYLVMLIDGQIPFLMPIEISQIKDSIKQQLLVEEEQQTQISKKADKKTNSKIQDIEDVIVDIVEGKYSESQLRNLRIQAEDEQMKVEQLIESINLHLGDREDEIEKIIEESKKKAARQNTEKRNNNPINDIKTPINVEELYSKVVKTLIAQDEAARRVIVEIARKEMDDRKKREGILLTGPTGVGKTKLMKLISKHLDRPILIIDSTQLTIPGYVGKDIEEYLWELYESCGRNIEKAEHAIIYIDEIDKKGSKNKSDVSGKGVLNLLLSFIEGTTYDATPSTKSSSLEKKVKINTSNMTIILGGAFTDVYKNLNGKNGLGFGSDVEGSKKTRRATIDDFVEKAMMPDEFMGRVTIVELNPLDATAIRRIMTESDESALKIQEKIFRDLGVRIRFTDDYITEIAQRAEKKGTGARGLNALIDDTTWKAFDKIACSNGEYEEVIIDKETIDNPSAYQLVKRKKGKK